jgi:peptidoglycan/LPS O-acetylase OafA/YrhL
MKASILFTNKKWKKFNELFFPHDNKKEHFKALDGLRGLAVLLVLLSHSSNANIFFNKYLDFDRIGKIGVNLFFILSAYLLDRQIALVFSRNESSLHYWKNYFLRRFLRIYPLFLISLTIHLFLTKIGFKTVIDDAIDVFGHLSLLKGESIFWSIPVEFKYYFISPLLIWFLFRIIKLNNFLMLFLLSGLIFFSFSIQWKYKLPIYSTFRYLPIFLVGTFLSVYEIKFRDNLIFKNKPLTLNTIGIFAIAIIVITIPSLFHFLTGLDIRFHSFMFYFPYALIWGALIYSIKFGGGLIRKLFENKLLRFIGTISFSMYLFHMLFLKYTVESNIPSDIKIFLFFIFTILFSSITYLLIERPISKIRFN